MPQIKIAVDAMGSDQAPSVEVDGAIRAASEYGIHVVLVGQEDRVSPLLQNKDAASLPIGKTAVRWGTDPGPQMARPERGVGRHRYGRSPRNTA